MMIFRISALFVSAALLLVGCDVDESESGEFAPPEALDPSDDAVVGEFDMVSDSSRLGSLPQCGDGVVDIDVGEQCDDGNLLAGDGCSSTCQLDGSGLCPLVTVAAPPASFGLDPFYTQWVDAAGIPVVGSSLVDPDAFAVARFKVVRMVAARPDVRDELLARQIRVGIMAETEVTTDMPEHADLGTVWPGINWDQYRGLGATLSRPLSSVGEENLLRRASDPYYNESILYHEFAHSYYNLGALFAAGGVTLPGQLNTLYHSALADGLWSNTYAATNTAEYWAEAVQSWFNSNAQAIPTNGIHNHVDTLLELEAYDPDFAALLSQYFTHDPNWQAYCTP